MISYLPLLVELGKYRRGEIELDDVVLSPHEGDLGNLFSYFQQTNDKLGYILSNARKKKIKKENYLLFRLAN